MAQATPPLHPWGLAQPKPHPLSAPGVGHGPSHTPSVPLGLGLAAPLPGSDPLPPAPRACCRGCGCKGRSGHVRGGRLCADPPARPPPRRVYRLHERLVAIRTEYNLRLKSGAPAVSQTTVVLTQRGRPELDDVTLRYLQDLLAWVEENQRRVDGAEWGVDLPTVESQLGSHRGLHQSVDEFRAKIERARADEVTGPAPAWRDSGAGGPATCSPPAPLCPQAQLSPGPRSAYHDCLSKLDLQYAKLLVSVGRGDGGAWGVGAGATAAHPACPGADGVQGAAAAPGEPARLRQRRHQGAAVAEREGGGGGGLRLERPQPQRGRQEGQLLGTAAPKPRPGGSFAGRGASPVFLPVPGSKCLPRPPCRAGPGGLGRGGTRASGLLCSQR